MKTGTLYLLQMPLGPEWKEQLTPQTLSLYQSIDYFVCEHARTARRFVTQFRDVHPLTFETWNKKSPPEELQQFIHVLKSGTDIAYISEAGMPCIADPGHLLVRQAHQQNIRVEVVAGTSSILLALIGSGLFGQKFRFNGYLPPKGVDREKALKRLQADARKYKQTEIFMETPYRNMQMIESALNSLAKESLFCIAANLTQQNAYIKTLSIAQWKQTALPDLHKVPAIFAIQ